MVIKMPTTVEQAITRLEHAGYEAYAVGGCVRDSILGRTPNDWDITTSARPEETAAVFSDCRTVETGVKHGTLTVIMDGMPLEITTYRSDGEYADNRHPVQVTFSRRVEDDLSRRDFTVNAMAYHPVRGLVDLYGGRTDLERRTISCVGDPATRFGEDGLRILRAIRFASVLDFEIAPETARAIHECRALLGNIAAERIREEFCKLICGKGAVRILREYSDVIAEFLPELGACVGFAQNSRYHCYDVYEHSLQALSHTQSDDLITRLSILLHDVGKPLCYTEDELGGHFKGHGPVGVELTARIMRRLRFDNSTAESVTQLVEYHDRAIPAEAKSVKRLMCRMSDENILRLMEVQRCDRLAHAPEHAETPSALREIPALMRAIRDADECLSLKTLQIKGDDLIAMGVPRGKEIGVILNALLEQVIDGALPNDRERLLTAAEGMIKISDCEKN
jgi:tRNA nucleotidyltransferase (CCA-adding enzyme)